MLHLLQKSDGISRQSGFLARNLITHPISSMGERLYQNPPKKLLELKQFHTKITDCLDQSLHLDIKGCHNIPTLTFSPRAKRTWINFFNEIEKGLGDKHKWLDLQDVASKSSENVARLAALLHLFSGSHSNKITTEPLEQAIDIVHWHLLESKGILNQPNDQDFSKKDATKLLNWILLHNIKETTPRHIQQYSPLRDKLKRNQAIFTLTEHNYIKEVTINNKTIIQINPAIFIQ